MFGKFVKHRTECVQLIPLKKFLNDARKFYGTKDISYDEGNRGLIIEGKLHRWMFVASDLEWFDDAEIVTDKNENERVMVWMNV